MPVLLPRGMTPQVRLITRASPLALRQAELVAEHLAERMAGVESRIIPVKTTGDRRQSWSLQEKGGKGLFTKELEEALLAGDADLAIHSAKDLPTDQPPGLSLAAYLPREHVHDVLIMRQGLLRPELIASGSPRRRAQVKPFFPRAVWTEIRGNVETRLNKITKGDADATLLAAAGLNRLGLQHWPGLTFLPLSPAQVVPAAGQGAIALQCRMEDMERFGPVSDRTTRCAVEVERIILAGLGGGCHNATAVCCLGPVVHVFDEQLGRHTFPLEPEKRKPWPEQAEAITEKLRAIAGK